MSSFYQLDFEKPVVEIERRIESLAARLDRLGAGSAPIGIAAPSAADATTPVDVLDAAAEPFDPIATAEDSADPVVVARQIDDLRERHRATLSNVYSKLTAWETVRVARHPKRPQTRDYIEMIGKDFCELHGDRRFGDDPAMVVGFVRFGSIKCLVVGHHKGRTTAEKISCHFGCAHPEGYRKALLKMQLAEKLGLPIVTFVDTPGAYPGIGAEQRGQAEAIAVNMREMSRLKTPIISLVIGEGGSGGALGIAVADHVAMLEYSWYSVISPEGCAAILWKQANEQTNTAAAASLKLTSKDNLELGIVDSVLPEPLGGAHRDPRGMAATVERWIVDQIQELRSLNPAILPQKRYERFRKMGSLLENA